MGDTAKEVTVYSTPTCHFCHLAKDYLDEKGVAYTEHNVAVDAEQRQKMVEMTGQLGVPVIQVGEDVMVGFDQGKLSELLGIQA